MGVEGTVELEVEVDETGRVAVVHIISGEKRLANAAREVVLKKWRYRPATRGGVPVPDTLQVSVAFEMPR